MDASSSMTVTPEMRPSSSVTRSLVVARLTEAWPFLRRSDHVPARLGALALAWARWQLADNLGGCRLGRGPASLAVGCWRPTIVRHQAPTRSEPEGHTRNGMDESIRTVDVSRLRWPSSGHLSPVEGNLLNRDFQDLSDVTWLETRDAIQLEDSLLDQLVADPEAFEARLDQDTDLYEDTCMTLRGLDIGVASAAFALSAFGCLTFSSDDGRHDKNTVPHVTFCAKAEHVPTVLRATEEAGCSLRNITDGMLAVESPDMRRLLNLAKILARLTAPSA
jgi:hypothetical protein